MNELHKKIIQIDLDGVLNQYHGNYVKDEIPPMNSGAETFLKKLSEIYTIELFTVRDKKLCKQWLKKNNLFQFISTITNIKNPQSFAIIDDRAINFNGNYEEIYNKIINFKPHWK